MTRTGWTRTAAVVTATAILAGGAAMLVGVACIPDLPPDDAFDAGDDSPICGNGVTDFEAGEQCDPGQAIAADAEANGCTGECRVSCPSGVVWSRNNHCYSIALHKEPALYLATQQCTGLSHVVTVASDEEMDEIATSFGGVTGPIWIGITTGNVLPPDNYYSTSRWPEPGWSPTCPGCFAVVADAGPLPGGGSTSSECVQGYTKVDASWRQVNCTTPAVAVICEQEPNGRSSRACDGGFCFDVPWTLGVKRYVYVQRPADADAAADDCARLGGTLVTLQSSHEREGVWFELAHLGTPSDVWIGLSLDDAGAWAWDDGTDTDAFPPPWGDGYPIDTASTRAFLTHAPQKVDDTLARNEGATRTLPYVCQISLLPDAGEAGPPDASDAGDAGDTGDATLPEAGDDGGSD